MRWLLRVQLLLWVPVLPGQAPEPEVFSPLGRSFSAMPDEERQIEKADLALAKGTGTAELLLAAARARDNVLRFSESIPLYTRGMDEHPGDARFPRFRGHRFISIRRFDPAIMDLKRAADLAPASFDVSYHLALAYYLRGDYNHAAREYQRCLAMAATPQPAPVLKGMPSGWRSCYTMSDDTRVAIVQWAWCALRRAGKPDEAARVLGPIQAQMDVKENVSYFRTLLLYKGLRTESQTMASPFAGNVSPTVGYGVGLWHWLEGRKERACATWERVLTDKNWAAFGFIAAETEMARGACKPAKKR